MEYNLLGKTGMRVSELCLGTMQFGWSVDEDTSITIMDKAWDLGINFFDTADVYSRWSENSYSGKSEEIIGKWLKQTGNRDDLILATKVRHPVTDRPNDQGLSRRHITRQLKGSLDRLNTKWIDLYQTHAFDENVPIRLTLQVLTDLMTEGKVDAIGASNYPAWRLMEALSVSSKYNLAPFMTLQPPYSLARRHRFEPHLMDLSKKFDIGVIPYSPLSGGFLTGKYQRGQELPESDRAEGIKDRYFNERGFSILEVIEEIAQNKGVTVAQVSLAWVMHQPTISAPIIGATSVEQLEETVKSTEVSFSDDELKRLADVSDPVENRIIY